MKTPEIHGVVIRKLSKFTDSRGWLSEIYRTDESDHQVALGYISMTQPGLARGPHEHLYQTDVFAFLGPGSFDLYLWDNRPESPTCRKRIKLTVGETEPTLVLVPPRVVHAYRCVSKQPGMVINLPDKLYKGVGRKEPVDEIRHEEDKNSFFQMD